jgi:hypothetical protein
MGKAQALNQERLEAEALARYFPKSQSAKQLSAPPPPPAQAGLRSERVDQSSKITPTRRKELLSEKKALLRQMHTLLEREEQVVKTLNDDGGRTSRSTLTVRDFM